MSKHILIVDNDRSVRESLKKVVQEAGYEVVLAADGQEAVDRFDAEQTDLLLLDLDLPGRDGWAVLEVIATHHPSVPVIIITGLPNQHHAVRAAGAAALMEKPLEVPALMEAMQNLLGQRKCCV
jgi:DNA-binding response OmpR family regulator